MAATRADRRHRTTRTSDRTRLPLTPKATVARRGVHPATGRGRAENTADPVATPAMHITPNVVVAARGDVRRAKAARGLRSYLQVDALDLRRFRA